ncbi:hypothetical protein [Legionella sp. km772]|uniref:hypothetical protein n=1 Tax=Legionella sp. km772 TaxID=2498111 RepID=UPI000F8C6FD6|nr:hypothetical protein [Legionella sp. km772]RUR04144.1 hypothetical protein ELY15_15830 [Legionella sp. km772]
MNLKDRPFVIKVQQLKDIVVNPVQNPFSDYEPVRTGEAALTKAIRRWHVTGRWRFSQFIIYLPPQTFQEMDLSKAKEMLHHYLQNQINEHSDHIVLFKKYISRVLINSFLFLGFCLILVSLINNQHLIPHLAPIIRKVLSEGFTVVGWVVLWRPIDLILDRLGELRRKNLIYHKLIEVPLYFKEEHQDLIGPCNKSDRSSA